MKAISPHTEADDPALLVCLLTAFGSAVGWKPYFDHGKRHGANLFTGLVGPTACRKGTATGIAKSIISSADPEWENRVQHEGFGSGEGLIWSVRDPNPTDPVGITDKRLLVVEEEWAKTFTLSANDKSILTPIIRGAYDRIPIGKKNKGDNAYGCREPHVSIIGHITADDLRQSLTGKMAVSIANGFLNRFLLVDTRRTKFLPRGGRYMQYAEPYIGTISKVVGMAKGRGLMELDIAAGSEWDALYSVLETRPDGVAGAVTGRASDMVMKLAMVYALADGDDAIRVSHLRASLAVWRYCEATAFALFGFTGEGLERPTPEPDPLWLQLLNAISSSPGVSRSELTVTFRRIGNADAIGKALQGLKEKGMAYPMMVKTEGSGRPGERWYPGSGGGDGGEEKPNNSPLLSPITDPGSPDPLNERKNSPNPFADLVVGDDPDPLNERKNSPEAGERFGGAVNERKNSPDLSPDPNSFIPSTGDPEPPEPLTPDPDSFIPSTGEGDGGTEKVSGDDVVRHLQSWASAINANPQHPEPRPHWMYDVGKCPNPPTTGITAEWVRGNVILKLHGDGFRVTNTIPPEVADWLGNHFQEALELAKESAELEKLIFGEG